MLKYFLTLFSGKSIISTKLSQKKKKKEKKINKPILY